MGVKRAKRPWNCKNFVKSQFFLEVWKLVVTNSGDDATCSPFHGLFMSRNMGSSVWHF